MQDDAPFKTHNGKKFPLRRNVLVHGVAICGFLGCLRQETEQREPRQI